MEESRIRIIPFSNDLHPKLHSEIGRSFGKEFKLIKTPISDAYYPETDDSPLCTEDDSTKYRSLIGCCIEEIRGSIP
jgi:hypothetical protein